MDDYASIDFEGSDGRACSFTGFMTGPHFLSTSQNLNFFFGGAWYVCNWGPVVWNTTWAHAITTGYGWGANNDGRPCNYAPGGGTYYNQAAAVGDGNGNGNGVWRFSANPVYILNIF